MSEITLKDIAERANVSAATVDRVIHGRGNSRPETIERIRRAIDELGYRPNRAAAQLVRGRAWRIGVMMPATPISFLDGLAEAIPDLNARLDGQGVDVVLRRTDNNGDALRFASELEDFASGLDACAVLAPADPSMVEVVRRLTSAGTPVATLVSDIPTAPRTLFAGPNNEDMGSVAAQLSLPALRLAGGMAVVIKPQAVQDDHEARFVGFCRALRGNSVSQERIHVVTYPETNDANQLIETVVAACRDIDTRAFYLTGGRTEKLLRGVEAIDAKGAVRIGTDLTPISRRLLVERRLDFTVAADAIGELNDAVEGLLRKLNEPLWEPRIDKRPIQVFTRFNLPGL